MPSQNISGSFLLSVSNIKLEEIIGHGSRDIPVFQNNIDTKKADNQSLPLIPLMPMQFNSQILFSLILISISKKQAGAELGQAQLPLCSVDQKL